MSRIGNDCPTEYSDKFDTLRQNRVQVSMHKYGSAKINFGENLVSALGSANMCISKYLDTGNTEYLVDAANYIMFEFMYPTLSNAHFEATPSEESAGTDGIPYFMDKFFNVPSGDVGSIIAEGMRTGIIKGGIDLGHL